MKSDLAKLIRQVNETQTEWSPMPKQCFQIIWQCSTNERLGQIPHPRWVWGSLPT